MTLILWAGVKPLTWDIMAVCPVAMSYLDAAANSAESTAESTSWRKTAKSANLGTQYIFSSPSLDPMHESARH